MPNRLFLPAILALTLFATALFATDDADDREVVTRLDAIPVQSVFDASSRNEPLALSTAEEAEAYFDEDQLAVLNDQVDWESQSILVFAWRGSGGDRLDAATSEDSPNEVQFIYTPGLTRDLRPHLYVYAIDAEADWEVTTGRP